MNLKKRERRNEHRNLHAQSFPFPQDNLYKTTCNEELFNAGLETEPQQGQTEALPSLNYCCSSASKSSKPYFPIREPLQHLYLHFCISRHIVFNFLLGMDLGKKPGRIRSYSICCSLQGLRKRGLDWQSGGGGKGSKIDQNSYEI